MFDDDDDDDESLAMVTRNIALYAYISIDKCLSRAYRSGFSLPETLGALVIEWCAWCLSYEPLD